MKITVKLRATVRICIALITAFLMNANGQNARYGGTLTVEQRVDSVLRLMTLDEKIGQLNQYNDDKRATGPVTVDNNKTKQVAEGKVGSLLNAGGAERTRSWQEMALKSRLKIPLIFGKDVIHGYKTTFPIPLAESCSWDLEAIEKSARIAAAEASAAGIHWTFAPMVDIARDPRWGRVMEGAGEDTYLASKIAYARVRGFQGNGFGSVGSLLACAKHFAAYGAAAGGREYNSVDMSDRMLWETYLPPFKAAVDAGAGTIMNAFNDLNGVPATGNAYLLRDILRQAWGFGGFVVSDWGSVGEMVTHGWAQDESEAAQMAIIAGCDMDMESRCYSKHLSRLVGEGKVPVAAVDAAARRILKKKFELALFDDPFRNCDPAREARELNNPAHAEAARDAARKSIVLLKNEKNILPLSKNMKIIAFIGPLVKEVKQNKGSWDIEIPGADSGFIVSQWEGVKNKIGATTQLLYAKGCDVNGNDRSGFAEAVSVAKQADAVVISIGERREMSGEAKSRSDISVPGVQEDLLGELLKTGKPVVVLLNAGRPLAFAFTSENAPAILYTWWLGSEAGNVIADVLFGDYNPSAKLTMTFPLSAGQIPIYYNHFNTGRPAKNDSDKVYKSRYIDLPVSPRYEFGFGLSYTTFRYGELELSGKTMKRGGNLTVSASVTNTGVRAGQEIVQLYLRDPAASVIRPVKELKGFQKIALEPGETKRVTFLIDEETLAFYNANLEWVAEPGGFELMIGASSRDIRLSDRFRLEE
jgi:beta-glucosidase